MNFILIQILRRSGFRIQLQVHGSQHAACAMPLTGESLVCKFNVLCSSKINFCMLAIWEETSCKEWCQSHPSLIKLLLSFATLLPVLPWSSCVSAVYSGMSKSILFNKIIPRKMLACKQHIFTVHN